MSRFRFFLLEGDAVNKMGYQARLPSNRQFPLFALGHLSVKHRPKPLPFKVVLKLGRVVHACIASTQEAETEFLLTILKYRVRPWLI